MARISTYAIDPVLDRLDKLHGTDENGVTRNFNLGGGGGPVAPGGGTSDVYITNVDNTTVNNSVINYITESDPRALAFLYHNNALHGSGTNYQGGTINISHASNSIPFSSVTTLKVSKFPFATHLNNPIPNACQDILSEHVGMQVIWSWVNDPNVYGIYECTSFVQDSSNTNFYDMGLTYVSGNGSLTAHPLPDLYILEPWGGGTGDKHYTHLQNNSEETWTVTHNLGKHPAVQAVVADVIFFPNVEHISNNQLKIYLSAASSGKAYCN
tara:strand:+ start:86 stop:892 length:807 start_codon:yes stop_codon:yes gene_type:complete